MKMMMVMLALLFASCGGSLPDLDNTASAPTVSLTTPQEGDVLRDPSQSLSVTFDAPLDSQTVTDTSFVVAQGRWTWSDFGSTSAIEKAVAKGTLVPLAGEIDAGDDDETWVWTPTQVYEPYQVYTLILTSHILSEAHLPLTSDARAGNRAFFFHYYSKAFASGDSSPDEPFGGSDPGTDDNPGTASSSDSAGGIEKLPMASALPWTELFLNEIYYDCDGNETDGCQFIELYGTPLALIAGVQVLLVNGSDGKIQKTIVVPEDAVLNAAGYYVIADARTRASDMTQVLHADLILNFDPQNGPDAVQLLDENGVLVDSVGYGEGMVAVAANGFSLVESAPAVDVKAGHSACRAVLVDSDANQADFDECVPTPGAVNSVIPSEETADAASESPEGSTAEPSASETPEGSEASTSSSPATNSTDSSSPEIEDTDPTTPVPQVMISEVVTDPQQDWNDSAGGDGIVYDAQVGNGTIGTTDEWIELYNASAESLDLRGWSIVMADSTPATHVFADGDKLSYFETGSSVSAWSPDTFLILGNPEGDLKNDNLTLSVIDPEGATEDEWFIENGDATGIENESWQRAFEDGEAVVEQGAATPWE